LHQWRRPLELPDRIPLTTASSLASHSTVEQLTVLFMPESAYGPTNNCIGIGDVLRRRGHRVVFAAEASWRGRLDALGFEEDLVDLAPPAEEEQAAGQFWTDFIRDTAPEFRKPTIVQLSTFLLPTWEALVSGALYVEDQLQAILDRTRPDVIVEDNVVAFAALVTHGAPFVRIMSCNPLEMRGADIPPTFSGYSSEDRTGWDEFRAEFDRSHRELWTSFDEWMQSRGAPPLPELEFIHASDVLNLYLYPAEVDYIDRRPLPSTWQRLDSSVRTTDAPFELPDQLRDGSGGLVYLSLGSLASGDVELMKRLVDVLSATRHRYVVSKGPLHAEYELADNMWGAPTLPQTNVLPLVDIVITHGGNNTTTECFHFGRPMVVLPVFWDQYDNAQRVTEKGFGRRLPTYEFEDRDLTTAIDELLADTPLRRRMSTLASSIQARDGTRRSADLIEAVAMDARRS
jgi:UDP:flavonoid glycosyltransferase YjiC (YdhE family)